MMSISLLRLFRLSMSMAPGKLCASEAVTRAHYLKVLNLECPHPMHPEK